MTPYRTPDAELRAARGATLTEMATAIGVSPTYLSALETGKRGKPTWALVQRIIAYFNVIWTRRRTCSASRKSPIPA